MRRLTRSYKGVPVGKYGLPFLRDSDNDSTTNRNNRRPRYYATFHSAFRLNAPKDLIIMYDVPSEKMRERDWFRRQLKNFDYVMIQKSVWVGPSPLPKKFLAYVTSIGLKDQLKTLKLAKPYKFAK